MACSVAGSMRPVGHGSQANGQQNDLCFACKMVEYYSDDYQNEWGLEQTRPHQPDEWPLFNSAESLLRFGLEERPDRLTDYNFDNDLVGLLFPRHILLSDGAAALVCYRAVRNKTLHRFWPRDFDEQGQVIGPPQRPHRGRLLIIDWSGDGLIGIAHFERHGFLAFGATTPKGPSGTVLTESSRAQLNIPVNEVPKANSRTAGKSKDNAPGDLDAPSSSKHTAVYDPSSAMSMSNSVGPLNTPATPVFSNADITSHKASSPVSTAHHATDSSLYSAPATSNTTIGSANTADPADGPKFAVTATTPIRPAEDWALSNGALRVRSSHRHGPIRCWYAVMV